MATSHLSGRVNVLWFAGPQSSWVPVLRMHSILLEWCLVYWTAGHLSSWKEKQSLCLSLIFLSSAWRGLDKLGLNLLLSLACRHSSNDWHADIWSGTGVWHPSRSWGDTERALWPFQSPCRLRRGGSTFLAKAEPAIISLMHAARKRWW